MQQSTSTETTGASKALLVILGMVQLSLAGATWADLARRRDDEINGSKRVWAMVIAVNFVGPLAYLRFGRRR